MRFRLAPTLVITVLLCMQPKAWADAIDLANTGKVNPQLRWCDIRKAGRFTCGLGRARFPKPNDRLENEQLFLRRPGYSGCVAVVEIDWTGRSKLNPKGFSYDPIPSLARITPAQIEQIWSESPDISPPKSGNRSYVLRDQRGNGVVITLTFEDDVLLQYQLAGEFGGRPFGNETINSSKKQEDADALTMQREFVPEKNINAISWDEVRKLTEKGGPAFKSNCRVQPEVADQRKDVGHATQPGKSP